jgi:16S rRNA processing protein RimM
MDTNQFFLLGYISKKHGYKGNVVLYIDTDHPSYYHSIKNIWINQNGVNTPFIIENIKILKEDQLLLNLKNIDLEKCERLLKKEVFIPSSQIPKLNEEQFFNRDVIDFKIYNNNDEFIGIAEEILEIPNNTIIQTSVDGREVLIPFNGNTLININKNKKELIIEIPNGLIELYTNG